MTNSGDRIIVATVTFAVPEKYVDAVLNLNTLVNIELLIDKIDHYRAISFNKCYSALQFMENTDGELVWRDPKYDTVSTVNRLVNDVRKLYQEDSDFHLNQSEYETDVFDKRS